MMHLVLKFKSIINCKLGLYLSPDKIRILPYSTLVKLFTISKTVQIPVLFLYF